MAKGESPKPVSATQKVLVCHSVIVSGTVSWRDACPSSLQQEEREENLLRSSQKFPGVSLGKAGRGCYQPNRDQIPNPGFWEMCPWFGLLCVIWLRYRISMANIIVCRKASGTSENSMCQYGWNCFFICRQSNTNHKWPKTQNSVHRIGFSVTMWYSVSVIREHNFRERGLDGL